MTLEQLRARLAEIFEELRAIDTEAGDAVLAEEQQTRFDALLGERTDVEGQIAAIEQRNQQRAVVRGLLAPARGGAIEGGDGARGAGGGRGGPNVIIEQDPWAVLEDRSMPPVERARVLVESNLRSLERHDLGGADNERHVEGILRDHGIRRGNTRWAENLLVRGREEYVSAWSKMITGRAHTLDEGERRAMADEERTAMAVGTAAQGGVMVPTHLDPTIILTNAGSSNVMRQYASIKTLTVGNTWHGVTSAGATASNDAELTEVSDDSPSVAQASIPVYKPQALIIASIEAFADIPGLTSEVMMVFADARDRLEAANHMTGSGVAPNPTGLFTAINASASLQITSTTAATIGVVDINSVYRSLPVRFRSRGTWVCNPLYSLAVKSLGTAVSSSYSGDLREPAATKWLDKMVLESDEAPTTQTTTALDQEIVFADLSAYCVVDVPGSAAIELVPHMLATANNLPNGSRGLYMHWRGGSGMPNINAGRILVDKTSA